MQRKKMDRRTTSFFHVFLLLTAVLLLHVSFTHGSNAEKERKAYIVYMGNAPKTHSISTAEIHHGLLSSVIGDEETARLSRIHSYGRSFNAFAAHLLPEEAERLKENENVVSVFPSKKRKLLTTRSWDFLGMPLSVERNHQTESDTIVGVLDTGIYIEVPSFDDKGYGPPPSKWKGVCQLGGNFTGCNNKVIGARSYDLQKLHPAHNSAADYDGHGTHTSSTAAGAAVNGASLFGLGKGTARGGVPSARLAIYKICYDDGCSDIDLLAGFDDAIQDGVDIVSLSVGGQVADYFEDPVAIGSFHAMKKGILTSCAAGNEGPHLNSVGNVAPWVLTVGASGMDRQFRAPLSIGNGRENDIMTSGISVNTFAPKAKIYPLTSATKAWNDSIPAEGFEGFCSADTLDKHKVKGKILFCQGGSDVDLKEMGSAGMIVTSDDMLDIGFTFLLPATIVSSERGKKIEKYINSTKKPFAVISKSKTINVPAPFVASFSSRGPNLLSPSILKPDVVAPGVDILAAYSKLVTVTGVPTDKRVDVYNIISGTSMACPHATGAAAYVKSFHPDWSPAAIKSALMTTATEIKIGDTFAEWSYGAGQIDPTKALNPGLVYDISEKDYIHFLCKQSYSGILVSIVAGDQMNCSNTTHFGGHDFLNYPSMNVLLEKPHSSISARFVRTVTNVGPEKSTYKAVVKAPEGFKITVSPNKLVFNKINEKKSFKVRIEGPPVEDLTVFSGSLEWFDSNDHKVKSPIVISHFDPEDVMIIRK